MAMKSLVFSFLVLVSTLAAPSAWAMEGTQAGQGGFLVLVFLGVCALVVVSQVVPALILMMGKVSGLARKAGGKKEMVLVPAGREERN